MSRKTDRRHAFNLIFQLDFHKDLADPAEMLEAYFLAETFAEQETGLTREAAGSPVDRTYVDRVFLGLAGRRESIDGEIASLARGWELSRLLKTDLAVLRLAIYELLHEPSVPPKVAINEAVDLSKEYSGGDSPAFVNGLLAQIVKSRQ